MFDSSGALSAPLRLALPYFRSAERGSARALLGALIALQLGQVAVALALNQWNNAFYNALQEKDWSVFAHQLVLFADLATMPLFDPRPGCGGVEALGLTNEQREADCLADEEQARDELKKRWPEFSAASRTECSQEIRIGGPPSYVELLACLDIARSLTIDAGRTGAVGGTSSSTKTRPSSATRPRP